jgi:hypothetical protein
MLGMRRIGNGLAVMLAAPAVLMLAACGSDDIQLNGKIFDAMGVSDATKSKGGDPKLAERSPLVVPPSLERLPPPGSAPPADSGIADIKDYDQQKVASKAELERQQEEFCKKNYEPAKARGDDSADAISGPLGTCRQSILSAVKKWNSGDDEGE